MKVTSCLVVTFFALVNGALFDGHDANIASIDYSTVPIIEKDLYRPPLQEIVEVLSRALVSNFESVAVSVEASPDFTQEPYGLTSPGLCGNEKLIELGGDGFLMPSVQRDKIYDLVDLTKQQSRDPAFLVGAGAGPWPYNGVHTEAMINLSVRNGTVNQGTTVVSVYPVGAPKGSSGFLLEALPNDETRSSLLGNYLLSDGSPGEVIKVVAKKRIGENDFITAIREALTQHYGDNVVGLGGLFLLNAGKVIHHVMPDFSETPIYNDADFQEYLHFFELQAPITHVGTLVTGDLELDLRPQHFHGWSAHGDAGHYRYDTTPDTVEYEGYFTVAASVVRIDAPPNAGSRVLQNWIIHIIALAIIICANFDQVLIKY